MLVSALVAFLHFVTLAVGFAAVVLRGRRLRDVRRAPTDGTAVTGVLYADALWGLAALSWIVTGLLRAFAGIEKASAFYLANGFFYVKMALFLVVFVLELGPMIVFTRWRRARARGVDPVPGTDLNGLIRKNDLETAAVVLIAAAATLMARGAWLLGGGG